MFDVVDVVVCVDLDRVCHRGPSANSNEENQEEEQLFHTTQPSEVLSVSRTDRVELNKHKVCVVFACVVWRTVHLGSLFLQVLFVWSDPRNS